MAYDPTTDIGKVRLLIGDTDEAVFTDAEIQAFLDLADDSIPLAAAKALRAMAASQARLEKRLKALDIELDTKGLAKELRELAKELEESEEEGAFAIAEMVPNNRYAIEERLRKEAQRQGL